MIATSAAGTEMEVMAATPAAASAAAYHQAFEAFRQIVEITTEVFQQAPTIKQDYDPEFPSEKYVVLIVETSLPPRMVLEKEAEWTHRVARVEPKWDGFRLSVKVAT